ncbi:MAG: hypothetical protein V1898_03780 [Patescibacteria group bacterium]
MESRKKQCLTCHKTFSIQSSDLEYFKKIDVPEPDLCFTCTKIKQLAWRNERVFYLRKCDKCNKQMVSCFSAEAEHPVYCNDCWWSDEFDATKYGCNYDFNKSFFEQFKNLIEKVPVGNLFIANSENSEYTNLCVGNKNCYMVTASDFNENCAYCSYSSYDKDSIDCTEVKNSELCYDSVDLDKCYECRWSQNLNSCNNCFFCIDCRGCTDCLGCANLRNQTHYIFNKKYSPAEYENKLAGYKLNTFKGLTKFTEEYRKFKEKQFYLFSHHINCENSTGDYLINCKNCRHSFNMLNCENSSNCIHGDKAKDCYDSMGVVDCELVYNSIACADNRNSQFNAVVWPGSTNIFYSYLIKTANDCFGCVSLHNNKFCILNKQYTENKYRKIIPKIKEHMKLTGEWGQFFPMNISPYAYNETVGQDLFPLTKEEVNNTFNGHWQENLPYTKGKETLKIENVSDNINEISDDITKQILACVNCDKNYKLVKQEYDFYQRLNIPVPRKCPDCRHKSRMSKRNSKSLWKRQCMCTQPDHNHQGRCTMEFETTFKPERKELIYCGDCYNKEIY